MTRRVYVKAEDIWRKRQMYYADHYEKRQMAQAFPEIAAERTLKACQQMPQPILNIDGSLDTWTYRAARAKPIDEQIQLLREAGTPSELFVSWYWSQAEWDNFVREFNSLPEPEPLYEIIMENGFPELKVVPYIMGTTRQVVPSCPQNGRVVPAGRARK